MKQSDDVFLFTLVDLFLQILFFGFLLVAIWYVTNKDMFKSVPDHQKIVSILKEYGVNNVKELEDFIRRLKGAGFSNYKELLDNLSDMEKAKAAGLDKGDLKSYIDNSELIKEKGGLGKILEGIESASKRICSSTGTINPKNGTGIPNILAFAKLTETSIILSPNSDSPEGREIFNEMLRKHSLTFNDVKVLPHDEFKRKFSFVRNENPDCNHYMRCSYKNSLTTGARDVITNAFSCY